MRTLWRSLVAVALTLAAGCLPEREPVAPSSPKIRLALHVELQGNVAGERIVEIRAHFQLASGEQATLPTQPTQVSVADGATVQQPVIIDIGPCNEASEGENAGGGCRFTIELTLKNGAGETLGSAEQGVGPVGSAPTDVPTFVLSSPQLTLAPANVAFGARAREALPAAQPVTVTATNSGATIGTLTATIAYTSGQGWLGASIDQNTHMVRIQPNTTALSVGTYSAVVTVTSSVDGMMPRTLPVTYQVALTPVLTISAAGDGSGSVTSSPAGIACTIRSGTTSGTCSASFEPNATVTLTATGAGVDRFGGWGGACSGQGSCTVTMGQALGVSARFDTTPMLQLVPNTLAFSAVSGGASPARQPVTVSNAGSGTLSGVAVSSITPPSPWLDAALSGTTISVGANPAKLSAGTYTATMTVSSTNGGTDAVRVTLTVAPQAPQPVLTVSAAGDGSGSVTSSPGGIACTIRSGTTSGTCSASFEPNASVTLTATVSGNDTFGGWGGACSGQASCTLKMGQSLGVSARFNTKPVLQLSPKTLDFSAVSGGASPARQPVTVSNAGSGTLSGVAVSSITPPSPWLDAQLSGTTISVGANPAKLSAGTYTATMTVSSTNGGTDAVRVTFTVAPQAPPPVLTVSAAGDGSGSVTSVPAGITCTIRSGSTSGTCSAPFTLNASVTLTATPSGVDTFGGWGGACSGQGTCTVTMGQALGVSARFNTRPVLQLVPNTLAFSGVSGGASPPQQTLAVVNSGSGTLSGIAIARISYVGQQPSAWLTASLGTSDGPPAVATVIVSADPAKLPAGTYQATVDVSSTNGGTATLGVTFTVVPPPAQLVVTPDTLTFFTLGEVPATQTVRASNAAGSFADLGQLSVDPATTSWLRVNIDGDIIAVTPDVSKLTVGTWSGQVIINSARGGRVAIRVTLFFSQIG